MMKDSANGTRPSMGSNILEYGLGKTIILLSILFFGALYALPNLYPDVPVVQVSGINAGEEVTAQTMGLVEQTLADANIAVADLELENGKGVLIFDNTEEQLRARDLLAKTMNRQILVGLNLMPTTPQWLAKLGGKPMSLGLDLQGGVHFLLEVDLDSAIASRVDAYREEAREAFRQDKLYYKSQKSGFNDSEDAWEVAFTFDKKDLHQQALAWAKKTYVDLDVLTSEVRNNFILTLRL